MKATHTFHRLLSLLLAMVMVLCLLPTMAAAENDGTVYISISNDEKYVTANDTDHTIMAYIPVSLSELSSIKLSDYNLSDFVYDSNGDNAEDITALHLYLYVAEKYYMGYTDNTKVVPGITKLDDGDPYCAIDPSGSAGSMYFNNFWGHNSNLTYYVNGQYPLESTGWGATADHIVLNSGDCIDLSMYTDWSFYTDPAAGFHYFLDGEGKVTHSYSAVTGAAAPITYAVAQTDWNNTCETSYAGIEGETIYYSKTLYDANADFVTTGAGGAASITFPSSGTWYLWADGGGGETNKDTIVSSPAYAAVKVRTIPTSQWPSFRGSPDNMAITAADTPISAEMAKVNWVRQIGTGYTNSPSVQIIVDDCLVTLTTAKKIYKLSLEDGSTVAEGSMTAATSWGYTPPVYASEEGYIIAPLSGGILQAFDAETLESVWTFTDAIGGQAVSSIAYSDGKLYVGFWKGEAKDANFVCVDASTGELQWSYTVTGGFYWAGAAAVGDFIVVGTDDDSSGCTGNSKLLVFKKTYGETETVEPVDSADLTGCGDQRSSMAYSEGKVYFTTKGGYLCSAAIDPATGTISDLKTKSFGAQSTSTPVVYGDYVYFATGSGISTSGSSGNFVIAAKDTLEVVGYIGLPGYPQCSMLLSTAYAESDGYLYFYSTYNAKPGGISLIKVKAADVSDTQLVELYDADGYSQYCITSIICDTDGNLYYKNDSGAVFSIGKASVPIPSITKDLSPAQVRYETNSTAAALEITASVSSGELSYEWQKSGDGSQWNAICDQTAPRYTPDISTLGTTYYRCKVTNTLDGKSESVCSKTAEICVKVFNTDTAFKYAVNASNAVPSSSTAVTGQNTIVETSSYPQPRLWIAAPEYGSVTYEVIEGTDAITEYVPTSGMYAYRLYFSGGVTTTNIIKVVSTAESGASETYYIVLTPDENYEFQTNSFHVTLVNAGTVELAQQTVTAADLNHDGKYSIDEVLYAAHDEYYTGGAEAGYARVWNNTYQSWSIEKLWGVENGGSYGYRVNDSDRDSSGNYYGLSSAMTSTDYLTAYAYTDAAGYSDVYTAFTSPVATATAGSPKTLTLMGYTYDYTAWSYVSVPYAGASVRYSSDGGNTWIDTGSTNSSGQISIAFPSAGTYIVEASYPGVYDSGSSAYTTAPTVTALCTVTVSAYVPPISSNINVTFRLIGAEMAKNDVDLSSASYMPKYSTWIATKSYTLSSNSTVGDLFEKALSDAALSYTGLDKNYISTITAPSTLGGYPLSEFTNGTCSGWMYTVNGRHPNYGLNDWKLSDGDVVVWHYVNDYRHEVEDWFDALEYPSLGDGTYWNDWLAVPDINPPSGGNGDTTASGSMIKPTSTVSGDAANAVITNEQVTDAIAAAEESGESAITILPTDTGNAKEVNVTIPKAAAQSIVDDSNVTLVVETTVGTASIPSNTLASIISQATGSTITITIEQKTAADVTDKTVDTTGAVIIEVTVTSNGKEITSFGGKPLTVSIPVDSTFTEDESYKVIVISGDGSTETLTGKCVKVDGKLYVEVAVTHLSTFAVTTRKAMPFTDVNNHWALDGIQYAYDNDLMNGVGNDKFDPDGTLNRAMLITILYRLEGEPAVTAPNPFTDVASGQWYTNAVVWASENSIVNGYGGRLFGPTDNITREQMAAMLLRYSNYKKYDVTKANDLASYTDAADISPWALSAMKWANAEGLINGRTATTIVSGGNATRAEAATILMRYMENVAK